jgi:hypothetical protein
VQSKVYSHYTRFIEKLSQLKQLNIGEILLSRSLGYLSSILLCKYVKTKIYIIIILGALSFVCQTLFLALKVKRTVEVLRVQRSVRSALFWDITRRRVINVYRRFETTYRSHLRTRAQISSRSRRKPEIKAEESVCT